MSDGNAPEAGERETQGTYQLVAWLTVAAAVCQIGIAFLGVSLLVHQLFGLVVGALAATLLWQLFSLGLPRSNRALGIALCALLLLQPVWIALRGHLPHAGDIHGFAAFFIFGLALILALDT